MASQKRVKKGAPRAPNVVGILLDLPWWLSAVMGLALYVGLHYLAGMPVLRASTPGQLVAAVLSHLVSAGARVAQYLVPGLLLAMAAASAWRSGSKRRLARRVAGARSVDVLNGMSWQRFEILVGEAYRLQGFDVEETGGGGADGGVDLRLRRGGRTFLVQAKHWRAGSVGVTVVRELYGVMAAASAAGGFVVTSGRFTKDAVAFANGKSVQLVDGRALHAMLREALGRVGTGGEVPTCPRCSRPMARRSSRKGAAGASTFWSCAGYPECRGTRQTGQGGVATC